MNTEGFKPNLESHLVPLLATKLEEAQVKAEDKITKSLHHSLLLQVVFSSSDHYWLMRQHHKSILVSNGTIIGMFGALHLWVIFIYLAGDSNAKHCQ